MAEWINVKERMPEKEGLYLIVYKGNVMCAYREQFLIDVVWNADMMGSLSYIPDEDVTHWMPIPEPPKEVE